jgi:pyruvate dehydrogenase phosphatase
VTCKPEVTYRKLDLDSSDEEQLGKPIFRFLVLATDGLWDELSSKEVVALVSGHLDGIRGSIPKSTLEVKSNGETQPSRYNKKLSKPDWTFKDENIGTHLIRNAFGSTREDPNQLRRLLSIPPPLSRRFRDDTSVLVLWWEPCSRDSVKNSG